MGLEAAVTPVAGLSEARLIEMLQLMQAYYSNVFPDQFRRDLAEKDMVITLLENGRLCGFSTWMLFPHEFDGRRVNVIFSGDTIIESRHWRSLALPVTWGRLMLAALAEHPGEGLYWLLISKGYKTYRFLPVFFREFYPSYRKETPAFERGLLGSIARRKFGDGYNAGTGVLPAGPDSQRLRPGVADLTEARRRDEHIAFFERANPGHARGDELVCLACCHRDNIHPYILRQLDG